MMPRSHGVVDGNVAVSRGGEVEEASQRKLDTVVDIMSAAPAVGLGLVDSCMDQRYCMLKRFLLAFIICDSTWRWSSSWNLTSLGSLLGMYLAG